MRFLVATVLAIGFTFFPEGSNNTTLADECIAAGERGISLSRHVRYESESGSPGSAEQVC
jgi:hypothetical protein